MSQLLIADAPLGETLERAASLARDALGADVVALGLLDEGGALVLAAATDERGAALDAAQREGGGPCVDAAGGGRVVLVDDVRDVGGRWPAFSERALELGVRSTLALPLRVGGATSGVIGAHATSPGAFAGHEQGGSASFVAQAAVVLANARAYWQLFDLATGLRAAMASRTVIEQAKGIVMARTGRTADEAFDLLQEQAEAEHRTLRDVAAELAARQGRS